MKNETKRALALAAWALWVLAGPGTALALSANAPLLAPGSTWLVEKTTTLDGVSIPAGAAIAAPAGHSLTMTVNGVGTPIQPGTYTGTVVFTVTDDILVQYGKLDPHHYRAAIYVDDGKVVTDKSIAAAVVGGTVTDHAASHVSITSNEEKFNGIYVTGHSTYRIDNPRITFTGNGGNDFAGFGAGIMVSGKSDLTVNDAIITTKGAVRTAVFAGGASTLHVNRAHIDVFNGTLPADYKFNIDLGRMMEVPWMLGLTGNVRATNLVDHATAYWNDSHIRTQGWGAMSTDDTKRVRLYVRNSTIETVDSGYGAYSIGDSLDRFSHCTFNVHDIGMIMAAEGSGTFTDGTVVNSGRFGVMMHSGAGGGTLTIDKGSVFNTKSTAIQIKGRGSHVIVDHASINAGNGIILQAMINDDPFAMGPGAGPPVGVQAPAGAPPGAANPTRTLNSDVAATFRHVTLKGDIINSRTAQGDMQVALESAHLNGAISIATAAASTGKAPTAATYYLIGEVTNTFGPSADKNGLQVRLDAHSSWTVTHTSYLSALTLAPGARVSAAKGETVALQVDGQAVALKAGAYRGHVVLQVTHS